MWCKCSRFSRQSSQHENYKLPRTDISHAKIVVGVVFSALNANITTANFYSEGLSRHFAPSKVSRYTVCVLCEAINAKLYTDDFTIDNNNTNLADLRTV